MAAKVTDQQWADRLKQLSAAEAAVGKDCYNAVIRLTGWSHYTLRQVRMRRDGLVEPPPEHNLWKRELPIQHKYCEKCYRPPHYRDHGKLEKFRGVMVCCPCLLKWVDLPEGRDVRNVKYETKAKRMARILARD